MMTQAELHAAISGNCQASDRERDRLVSAALKMSVLADPRRSPAEAAYALEMMLRGEWDRQAEMLSDEVLAAAWAPRLEEVA